MTDTDRPTPAQSGDAAPAVRDSTAGRDANGRSRLESSGGGAGSDPDALDQSVGRSTAQGDARGRNSAI